MCQSYLKLGKKKRWKFNWWKQKELLILFHLKDTNYNNVQFNSYRLIFKRRNSSLTERHSRRNLLILNLTTKATMEKLVKIIKHHLILYYPLIHIFKIFIWCLLNYITKNWSSDFVIWCFLFIYSHSIYQICFIMMLFKHRTKLPFENNSVTFILIKKYLGPNLSQTVPSKKCNPYTIWQYSKNSLRNHHR